VTVTLNQAVEGRDRQQLALFPENGWKIGYPTTIRFE